MTVTTRAYRLLEGCRGITDEVLVCKHHPFGHSSGTTRVTYSDKVFWFRRLKGEDNIVTGPPSCFPLPPPLSLPLPPLLSLILPQGLLDFLFLWPIKYTKSNMPYNSQAAMGCVISVLKITTNCEWACTHGNRKLLKYNW